MRIRTIMHTSYMFSHCYAMDRPNSVRLILYRAIAYYVAIYVFWHVAAMARQNTLNYYTCIPGKFFRVSDFQYNNVMYKDSIYMHAHLYKSTSVLQSFLFWFVRMLNSVFKYKSYDTYNKLSDKFHTRKDKYYF